MLAARAAYPAGTRFLFAEKKPGKEKAERGTSRSPLHSPPKGRPFKWGRPNKGQSLTIFAATCLAWQYNAFLIGGKLPPKWHRTGAIPPQQTFSPVAHWGECRGGSPLCAFFPTAFFGKESGAPPAQGARAASTKSPGLAGVFHHTTWSRMPVRRAMAMP